ncbi:hypothetical protein ACVGVM_08165 [Pseudonocardia bannensis]|nr:hypothetical protein [Pseudonocardia bannensis]
MDTGTDYGRPGVLPEAGPALGEPGGDRGEQARSGRAGVGRG